MVDLKEKYKFDLGVKGLMDKNSYLLHIIQLTLYFSWSNWSLDMISQSKDTWIYVITQN